MYLTFGFWRIVLLHYLQVGPAFEIGGAMRFQRDMAELSVAIIDALVACAFISGTH
jgi:hypothetical protein